jgi:hypothetical protein
MNRKSIICIGLAFAFIHASAWAGTISTVAVIDANGGVTLDSAGDIYAANFEGTDTSSSLRFVWKLSPTGAFDPVPAMTSTRRTTCINQTTPVT